MRVALLLWIACGAGEGPEVAAAAPAAVEAQVPAPRVAPVDVVLLGTGTPIPDPERSGPATAVVASGLPLLFDAGPGVARRAHEAALAHQLPALQPENIRHIFLTHLHSDHTTGLPDLILGGWVLGRDRPLRIVGPPGTRTLVDGILASWAADVAIRTGPGEELDPSGLKVEVVELSGGEALRDGELEVTAFAVPHGTWPVALGYRVQAGERRVVISGDTAPTDAVVDACGGCDVLVHEVYSQRGFDRVPSESFQAYHSTFHTSGPQLAEIATRAKPVRLVLTHQLFFGASVEQLLDEVRGGYDGQVVSGLDLQRLSL